MARLRLFLLLFLVEFELFLVNSEEEEVLLRVCASRCILAARPSLREETSRGLIPGASSPGART